MATRKKRAVGSKKAVTRKTTRAKKRTAATKTPVTVKKTAKKKKQLTCFVVTGFGNKTDYSTGRVLNLDKTYEQIVRPACDKVNVNCFRAIDANLTGSIDSIMYRWIYEADIVIADLSTLNANVFYELGVRHAQRPNTTIIIAETVLMQKIPFDLSSFVIHSYEHGGEQIGKQEQKRFVDHLSGLLRAIIDQETRRGQQEGALPVQSDSPVFQFLNGMTPPDFAADTYIEPPAYIPPSRRQKQKADPGESLAAIIDAAETAKKSKNFDKAIELFGRVIKTQTTDPDTGKEDLEKRKADLFIAQRFALVTYKGGEQKGADGKIDKDKAIPALHKAKDILARHCAPEISTDPETLGLSGAINKRLFELTGDRAYLELAIGFYERGFYVKQDYYNGINVAYMYTQSANLPNTRFDAIVRYGHANMIRRKVIEICEALIKDEAEFAKRGDKEWVLMTLAEAYQGLGQSDAESRLEHEIKAATSDKFSLHTYREQKGKLAAAMSEFELKVRPGELGGGSSDNSEPAATVSQTSTEPLITMQTVRPAAVAGGKPILIDADIVPGKSIRSIEVQCKIEYS